MDSALLAAIAAALGIVVGKLFDTLMAKGKNKVDTTISDRQMIMQETAALRQEMREEIRVLRSEVSQLREENFQLRAENTRLLFRISELEDELKRMRSAKYEEKGNENDNAPIDIEE